MANKRFEADWITRGNNGETWGVFDNAEHMQGHLLVEIDSRSGNYTTFEAHHLCVEIAAALNNLNLSMNEPRES